MILNTKGTRKKFNCLPSCHLATVMSNKPKCQIYCNDPVTSCPRKLWLTSQLTDRPRGLKGCYNTYICILFYVFFRWTLIKYLAGKTMITTAHKEPSTLRCHIINIQHDQKTDANHEVWKTEPRTQNNVIIRKKVSCRDAPNCIFKGQNDEKINFDWRLYKLAMSLEHYVVCTYIWML